jgi:hypothetical protein
MTWHLIHWRVLALGGTVGATVGISRQSQRDVPIDLKAGPSKIRRNLPALAYRAKPLGISRCDGRYMPMVARTVNVHSLQISSRVVAKSAGSGEQVFTSIDVLLYGLSL